MQPPVYPIQHSVLSPCIGICNLDPSGLCVGCRRTSAEIAAWTLMDDAARLRVIESLATRNGEHG
ncbi:MAG: DUF1289 domain-containing protein [Luteimonas sp.]